MTSFQWFCFALRVIGAWNFVMGLEHFLAAFNGMRGYYTPASTQPFGFFLQGCLHITVALVLMRFAPFLAVFAYPKPTPSTSEQNPDATDV
ncbi:hypothetical protein [Dyella psychrodurans]|uniref:Transmembrane protein n=1 Tax=Dyella psychrodurans TaxID=1927960 RepID=A0A370WZ14_9GAMM|nr:hypothetical protein [Dyella psychrodurans]RDS81352.1 hypothetical protein DWU99_16850 [Dyella psychrodurans]